MYRRLGLICLVVAVACGGKDQKPTNGSGADSRPPTTITLIALAEMRGQIGPCGCTSDPLGDLSRTAKLVEDARAAGPTLVVDAGSLLYTKSPVPPHLAAQEEMKADLLASTYKDVLGVAAVGLGPADLGAGPGKTRLPRLAVNAKPEGAVAGAALEGPHVLDIGGMKVGVFGVIAEGVKDIAVTDPIAASKQAAAQLKKDGAQLIVGLVQASSKKDAVKLVRDAGVMDLAIAGLGAAAPEPEDVEPEATKIDGAWLVIPANRGQVVSRLSITLRGDAGPLIDAVGPGAAKAKEKALDAQIAIADADLTKFKTDKDADPAFVKQRSEERGQLAADKADLMQHPTQIPAKGNYFTLDQVRINKPLACDPKVQSAVSEFFASAGKANVEAQKDVKVPPPAKGEASYVGTEACADCHQDAVDFWKTTVHSHAWETLVERGQQYDLDCIGCHVTGWNKPGGSNLAHNDNLRDIQCETCHGPGSIHVAKGGEEKPSAVIRRPADDFCRGACHTKEHSDTFDLQPYLRDITGPGHGANLRAQLGNGPTGKQLRSVALAKAGQLGPGCVR
jgi:hypothetical protein